MISKISGAVRFYKLGIFRVLLNRVAPQWLQFQTMILYKYDLAQFQPKDEVSAVPVFRIQKAQDELFTQFHKKFPAKTFINRLNNGRNTCYMAVWKNEPAGYAWAARRHLYMETLDYTFPLKPDELFIYSCYVEKYARGKGIYPLMLHKALQDHSESMYRCAYIGVSSSNSASIRGIEKAGFKRYKKLSYIKIGKQVWYNGIDRQEKNIADATVMF